MRPPIEVVNAVAGCGKALSLAAQVFRRGCGESNSGSQGRGAMKVGAGVGGCDAG